MPAQKSIENLWNRLDSGLFVPVGTASNYSQTSSQKYLDIKAKAQRVEKLYKDRNIRLSKTSDLAQLIEEAKAFPDDWLLGRHKECTPERLFRTGLLDRIATAILALEDEPNVAEHLRDLSSGPLNLLDRDQSRAKDILWELELLSILKRRAFDASLKEPPDIVINTGDASIGIACKKIYSEKHVEKVLSNAVHQIEPDFDVGIVAVNIDDLLPPNALLTSKDQANMSGYLNELNAKFIRKHERYLRKYLSSGRIISAMVSTSCLADVRDGRTRFNSAMQITVWTIPGLEPGKNEQLRKFYRVLMDQG